MANSGTYDGGIVEHVMVESGTAMVEQGNI